MSKNWVANLCDKVRQGLNKLRPIYYFETIDQEIKKAESSELQIETRQIEKILDDCLMRYAQKYHQGSNNFKEIYQERPAFKRELRTFLTHAILNNCTYLNRCDLVIGISMEPGFFVEQQILIWLYKVNGNKRIDESVLYRTIRITDSGIKLMHTKILMG